MPPGEGLSGMIGVLVYFLRAAQLQLAVNVIGNRPLLSQQENKLSQTSAVASVVKGQSDLCPRLAWRVPRLKLR